MYDISLILRLNAQKKNGEFPVNIRLKVGNEHCKKYSTKVSVSEVNWDTQRCVIKKSDPLFFTKNEELKEVFSCAEKILLLLDIEGKVSYNCFESEFVKNTPRKNTPEITKTCFHTFAAEFVDLQKAKWSFGHQKNINSVLQKIKEFREVLYLEDLNLEFWQNYEKHLREEKDNSSNTVHKNFKYFKPILRLAVKRKIISDNDLQDYSIKKNPTNRDYLTIKEVKKLEKLCETYVPNSKHHNVLTYFLFMCYTGLRYSDLYNLRWANVVDNHLELITEKTTERVIIPLCCSAKRLMPEREIGCLPLLKVFKVLSNQKSNDYLKGIAIAANITKTVSCHVARHTFATISLTLGIPIEVVSKLLGHSDIQTTQIYAKIIDQKKYDEMNKWDNLKLM